MDFIQPSTSAQPPTGEEESFYEVEDIVDSRRNSNGKTEFLVKWVGYGSHENTWIPREQLHCPKVLRRYNRRVAARQKRLNGTPLEAGPQKRGRSGTPKPTNAGRTPPERHRTSQNMVQQKAKKVDLSDTMHLPLAIETERTMEDHDNYVIDRYFKQRAKEARLAELSAKDVDLYGILQDNEEVPLPHDDGFAKGWQALRAIRKVKAGTDNYVCIRFKEGQRYQLIPDRRVAKYRFDLS